MSVVSSYSVLMLIIVLAETKIRVFRKKPITREKKRPNIVSVPLFSDGPGTKAGSKRSHTTVLEWSGNGNRAKTFPHHGSGIVWERKRGSNVPAPRFWDCLGTETGFKRSRTTVLEWSGNGNRGKTFPHPGSGTVWERKRGQNVPAHLLWLWEQPLHFSRSQVERLNNLSVGRTESEFHHFCSLVGNLFFQLPYFLAWKPA